MMESQRPVIYIIIPSYNTADYLCRCLDSLRAQQGAPPFEIYVVDNASRDDSVERVRRDYPEVHLSVSEHNGGFAYAVNIGLRAVLTGRQGRTDRDSASGTETACPTNDVPGATSKPSSERPYDVLLLNSDTDLPPTALAQMVAFLEAHPEAGVVGPQLVMAEGQIDLAGRRSFPTPAVAFYRLFGLARLFPHSRRFGRYNLTYLDPAETAEVDAVSGAFMLVRGEVVEAVGLLDEAFFFYGEDLDWAYRIKALGWKIFYYPAVRVRHWKRASSQQRARASVKDFYQAMRLFHRKHFAPHSPWLVNAWVELGISLREGLALLPYLFRHQENPE